jgi:hypothetical protein
MNERPELTVLEFLELGAIEAKHLEHFVALAAACWDGTTPEDLVAELRVGRIWMWRVRTTGDAIVLTRVIDGPHFRTLTIDGIAGEGVIKLAEKIVEDLRKIAGFYQCQQLEVSALPPAWTRVAEKVGFRVVATTYVAEVNQDVEES